MGFWEEEIINPRDNESAIFEMSEDTIKILKKGGFSQHYPG